MSDSKNAIILCSKIWLVDNVYFEISKLLYTSIIKNDRVSLKIQGYL